MGVRWLFDLQLGPACRLLWTELMLTCQMTFGNPLITCMVSVSELSVWHNHFPVHLFFLLGLGLPLLYLLHFVSFMCAGPEDNVAGGSQSFEWAASSPLSFPDSLLPIFHIYVS